MGPWDRLVENLSSRLAFFPPNPPTYQLQQHKDGAKEIYIQPLLPEIPKVLQCSVRKLPTKPLKQRNVAGGTEIVSVFCPHRMPGGTLAKMTILYSHGNAVDLGQMLPVFRELSRLLKVNVCGYDYSGYGCSTGIPTVNQTLSDITAVFDHLVQDYQLQHFNIILYGQSVGSGPTAYLGSLVPDLAGVVLHSPLMSGMRVLSPGIKWWPSWADVYPNHLLVPKIKSPTLIMHGTEDEVIHVSCGQKLYELCHNKYPPLWAAGYNHQNLELCAEYLATLEGFIAKVADKEPSATCSRAAR